MDDEGLWYFAFGSNMDSGALERRGVVPIARQPATIPQYRLCFNVPGLPYLEPAMASIEPRPASAKCPDVHGVAWRLRSNEWKNVVATEGGGLAYRTLAIEGLLLGDGTAKSCTFMTLVAWPTITRAAAPSVRYRDLLLRGAQDAGLPQDYLDYLLALPAHTYNPSQFGASVPGARDLAVAYARFWNTNVLLGHALYPKNVVVGASRAECLRTLCATLCADGDTVLIPAPCSDEVLIGLPPGIKTLFIHNPGWQHENALPYSLELLKETLQTSGDKVKALLLANPGNPIARSLDDSALISLLLFCQRHDLHLIADETRITASFPEEGRDSPSCSNFARLASSVLRLNLIQLGCDPSCVHVIWSVAEMFGQ
ncbi:hypothetical protein CAC42_6858 [Sphaceloma murrayae]|uniref:gamma-glutamylcyclotransferase n=1 Tax=Sphaceloma murrayae TaxID=2082308 RepID=A0A2K1QGQ1_9PEZI|nr:hypothetical protein CAC42_6858 [Sphaceloma murrayae]